MTEIADPSNAFPDQCKGLYMTPNGHPMFLGNMFGSSYVGWHDLKTGEVRVLYPGAQGSFQAGSSLLVSQPVEHEFSILDPAGLTSCAVSVSHHGKQTELVQRAPILQEPVLIPRPDALLSGTLYLPIASKEPCPAVVLVHGSGPQTRYMVQLYVEVLCSWGIAALAYDKRSAGKSTGGHWDVSYEILADDAAAAISVVQQHPRIDPNKVGLLGGSQAGWVMPLATVRSDAVAFIVMLAGPAVSIAQQNVHNVLYNLSANGLAESDVQAAVAHMKLFNRVLCTGEDWALFQRSLANGKSAAWADYAWAIDKPPTTPEAEGIRREMERDPLPILQRVRCPLLAIFGSSDNVVPPKENIPVLQDALLAAGKTNYTIEVVSEATHTFLKSTTGADRLFSQVTHMDLTHLAIVQGWLEQFQPFG